VETDLVNELFTIGEFSRTTHLSVKALRHYHDMGVLEPVAVDPGTGYRAYSVAQVPAAQVIRRLRDLDMPLDQVRAVLDASDVGDVAERDRVILVHLQQMEELLEQTQASVSSLRALLEGSQPDLTVEYRSVGPTRALAMREEVAWDDVETWLSAAFELLHATIDLEPSPRSGSDGALYAGEFFEAHVGEVVAFVPVQAPPANIGMAEVLDIPEANLAVAVHRGSFAELDRTYAALGSFVASRAIGVDGPIREHYLVTEADDASDLRTEVAWPVSVDRSRS
jgi:DNA-binding transcriptional MerR regulator